MIPKSLLYQFFPGQNLQQPDYSLNIVSLDQTLSTVDVAATSLNIATLDQTSSTVDVAATSLNIATLDQTTSTVDVAAKPKYS